MRCRPQMCYRLLFKTYNFYAWFDFQKTSNISCHKGKEATFAILRPTSCTRRKYPVLGISHNLTTLLILINVLNIFIYLFVYLFIYFWGTLCKEGSKLLDYIYIYIYIYIKFNFEPSLHRVLRINAHWGSTVSFFFPGVFRMQKYFAGFDKIMYFVFTQTFFQLIYFVMSHILIIWIIWHVAPVDVNGVFF